MADCGTMQCPNFNPVHETLARLQGQTDRLLEGQQRIEVNLAARDQQLESVSKSVDGLSLSVYGNGKPGYNVRLDRIERFYSRLTWLATGVVGPLVVYFGYIALQKWVLPG